MELEDEEGVVEDRAMDRAGDEEALREAEHRTRPETEDGARRGAGEHSRLAADRAKAAAVCTLQSSVRCFLARQRAAVLLEERRAVDAARDTAHAAAALCIQSIARRWLHERKLEFLVLLRKDDAQRERDRESEVRAAVVIQTAARGRASRRRADGERARRAETQIDVKVSRRSPA